MKTSSHHQTFFEFYRTTCIPFQTIPSFCDCFINGFHSKFLTADTKFLLMSLNFIAGSRYLHTSQERSRTFLRIRPMFSCSYPYFQIRSSSRISGSDSKWQKIFKKYLITINRRILKDDDRSEEIPASSFPSFRTLHENVEGQIARHTLAWLRWLTTCRSWNQPGQRSLSWSRRHSLPTHDLRYVESETSYACSNSELERTFSNI